MAKTKGKPGPKPKYGEREEIHVLVPVDDLSYIRSVTGNTTEWVIQAIQEKRQRESAAQPSGVTITVAAAAEENRNRKYDPMQELIKHSPYPRVVNTGLSGSDHISVFLKSEERQSKP